MRKYRNQLLAACLAIIGFLYLVGWAGDIDFCDQVIMSMTQEEYDSVKVILTKKDGTEPSEREIAHWWYEHHKD